MTIGIMPALLGTVEFVTGVFAFELVKPSSVVVTGGGSESATISALGSVDFSAATSLSLNDVFSAGYDNYMVVVLCTASAGQRYEYRLRDSGTDASGSNYTRQVIYADNTTVSASRTTSTSWASQLLGTDPNGHTTMFYGPYLAQPTAIRNVSSVSRSSAYIDDQAGTHSLSTSYDGFTLVAVSCNITGSVAVYGMRG